MMAPVAMTGAVDAVAPLRLRCGTLKGKVLQRWVWSKKFISDIAIQFSMKFRHFVL